MSRILHWNFLPSEDHTQLCSQLLTKLQPSISAIWLTGFLDICVHWSMVKAWPSISLVWKVSLSNVYFCPFLSGRVSNKWMHQNFKKYLLLYFWKWMLICSNGQCYTLSEKPFQLTSLNKEGSRFICHCRTKWKRWKNYSPKWTHKNSKISSEIPLLVFLNTTSSKGLWGCN